MRRAEQLLEEVLDEFPDHIGALNDLSYLWSDQNKHLNRALRMAQVACAGDPDHAAYRDSLGWALYRLERYEEAVAELKKAASADDEPDGVILDHLGDAYEKMGRTEEALDQWKRAVTAFEKSGEEKFLAKTRKKINNVDSSTAEEDPVAAEQ